MPAGCTIDFKAEGNSLMKAKRPDEKPRKTLLEVVDTNQIPQRDLQRVSGELRFPALSTVMSTLPMSVIPVRELDYTFMWQ